jgi:hypothetical protein
LVLVVWFVNCDAADGRDGSGQFRLLRMPACERNCQSTYEWVHSKNRNQLGTGRAESFSIISLLNKCEAISNGFVLWALEMIHKLI